MNASSVEVIVQQLNSAKVRYLVAGGLAVVAHGYVRFTADMDLMLALDAQNLGAAVHVLKGLGYVPRAPVDIDGLLDPAQRDRWIREKGLIVFSLFSAQHPMTEVDLFLEQPVDFEQAYQRAVSKELSPGTKCVFCGLEDLLAMKAKAARPRDIEDIAQLRRLWGGLR